MTLPCDAAAPAAFRGDLRRSFDFSGVGTFLPFPPLRRRDVCCVKDELETKDRDSTTSFAWTATLAFCCFNGRRRTRAALTTEAGPESKPALLVSLSVVPAPVRALYVIRLLLVVLAEDC